MLGIEKIRKTIENLDESCKQLKAAPTGGGLQEQWFLIEDGLYEVLFISRKAIAKQFRVWVRSVIKEIRLKGKYDLEEKLKEHQQLLHDKELEYQRTQQELLKYKEKTYFSDTWFLTEDGLYEVLIISRKAIARLGLI